MNLRRKKNAPQFLDPHRHTPPPASPQPPAAPPSRTPPTNPLNSSSVLQQHQQHQQHPTPWCCLLNPCCDADQIPWCRLTTADQPCEGQSMATACQLRAWQLPVVEVVMISTSKQYKILKAPLPTLILFSPPRQLSRIRDRTCCCRRQDTSERRIGPMPQAVATPRAVHLARPPPASQEGVHMTSSSSLRHIFGRRSVGGGGGSRMVYHRAEVTARYMKEFFIPDLLFGSTFLLLVQEG